MCWCAIKKLLTHSLSDMADIKPNLIFIIFIILVNRTLEFWWQLTFNFDNDSYLSILPCELPRGSVNISADVIITASA